MQEVIDRNQELAGKVAIVTGSARNIGRCVAEDLARAGAAVTINAVQAEDLCVEVANGIEQAGGKAIAVRADIREAQDVERLVSRTVEAFGDITGGRVVSLERGAGEPRRGAPSRAPPASATLHASRTDRKESELQRLREVVRGMRNGLRSVDGGAA